MTTMKLSSDTWSVDARVSIHHTYLEVCLTHKTGWECRVWTRLLTDNLPTHSELASLAARALMQAIGEEETLRSRLSMNLDQLVRLVAGASPTPGADVSTSAGNAALSAVSTPPASPTVPSGATARGAKK